MSDVPVAHVIDDEAPAPAAEGSDGGDGDSSEKPPSSSAGGGKGSVGHFVWKKNHLANINKKADSPGQTYLCFVFILAGR